MTRRPQARPRRRILMLVMPPPDDPAPRATQVIIAGHKHTTLVNSSTRHSFLWGCGGQDIGWWAYADGVQEMAPLDGEISQLRIKLDVAPGAGKSWTFALAKSGTPTSLTVTIANTETTGVSTGSVAISKGDLLTLSCVPSGTPATARANWCLDFKASGSTKQSAISMDGSGPWSYDTYVSLSAGAFFDGSVLSNRCVVPCAGTIKQMSVKFSAADPPGAGKSWTHTLNKNGSPTSLSVTISDSATEGEDTVNSVSVAAGDVVEIHVTGTNSPAWHSYTWLGLVFEASTPGRFPTFYASETGRGDGDYFQINGYGWINSDANLNHQLANACTISGMAVGCGAAPGAGKSYTFELYKNGVATGLTCTISDTNTVATASGSVEVADGDTLMTRVTFSGSPASTVMRASYVVDVGT